MQPFEHGGNIYQIKRSGFEQKLLDFSANINPLGLHEDITESICANIHSIVHYPDPQAYGLRQAITQHYNVCDKNLTLGNGAAELIYIYARVCEKKQALLLAPCFSEYQRACNAANLPVQFMYLRSEQQFAIDYELLIGSLPEQAVVFLGNPNNPTGSLLDKEQVVKLLKAAKNVNTDIFIDESFIDFVDDNYSCAHLMTEFDNLIILHSLTKIFAIPGLRLGFALFNEQIAKRVEQSKDVWNVNTLAQAAGVVALQQSDYLQQTRLTVKQLRANFHLALLQFDFLKIYQGSVNFMLIELQKGLLANMFRQKMLEQGILVRDCSNYPGLNDRFIRIAVRTKSENEFFIQVLKQISEELLCTTKN